MYCEVNDCYVIIILGRKGSFRHDHQILNNENADPELVNL